jgi:aspartyl-tRNA(Asn)/glutamyl-tRNA(Gln) amidotransferase subunit C
VAVTIDDVQHIAGLARIRLTAARAGTLVAELNTILGHMDALSKVDTAGVQEAIGVGARGLPVREDGAMPVALERGLDGFAPALRDGFFLVPRLSTHETPEEA